MNSDVSLKWPGDKVRQSFLDYFSELGHKVVPSSSLVPGDDPTLLFTNAGMVQFKDVFLGIGSRPYTRVVDSQKCMRVAGKHNDLDDVGRDDSHHTFFEMLGNWSFGDYYKAEVIPWAWHLLTEVWELDKEKLWVTVFEDEMGEIPRDDEAAKTWSQIPGFNPDRILFFGRDENFWEMAETGPCGPDSEIHYDRGEEYCDKKDAEGHVCQVNGDCERFLELWNLVFIQYNRTSPTNLIPLPEKHVDTGMGFERVVSILQNVDSNYKTDLFTPMLDQLQTLTGHSERERATFITPYRVIADHSRAASFLIADGVVPGNTGRNYVCRMVIRRASRFGGKLGFKGPFLAEIAETVIENYGKVYPELERNRTAILSTITDEEKRFHHTLDIGLSRLEQQLENLKSSGEKILPGEDAFDLYATYGLPLEISRDIAREDGLGISEEGFRKALESHRFASGAGKQHEIITEEDVGLYRQLRKDLINTGELGSEGVIYSPYDQQTVKGRILAIVQDGKIIQEAKPGDHVQVVIPETNFYVEAGGQVSDEGVIAATDEPAWEIRIDNLYHPVDGIIAHSGTVESGKPKVGDECLARLLQSRRWDIMRNHTATHLLHAGLQSVLGPHARQAGSLVAPDRLRFDFTHPEPMKKDEIEAVEEFVNNAILADYELNIRFKSQEEALAEGAMALFGEAYGETVRTISIGDTNRISYELCGGTHVPRTSVIGPFLIVNESSVAAGIRRVEAVTGRFAIDLIRRQRETLAHLSNRLATTEEALEERLDHIILERDQLLKELNDYRRQLAVAAYQSLEVQQIGDVSVIRGIIPDSTMETLRGLADRFRNQYPSGILVLASVQEDRPLLVAAITKDLIERGLDATDLVKVAAAEVGGGGGGRPTLAQAGGNEVSRLPEALKRVDEWVASTLS
jgi:alanyl-tRNA synthetase